MQDPVTPTEERADRQGKIGAIIGFLLFVALLIIPLFYTTLPKPGQPGILVNLGQIDFGQGEEDARRAAAVEQVSEPEPSPPAPQEAAAPPPPPPAADPDPAPVQRDVVVEETPQQIAIRKQKEREQARQREEAERQRRERAIEDRRVADERAREKAAADERRRLQEAEAARQRRVAEQAAQKQREAEEAERRRQAEADATRNRVGGLFGNGSGQGETGKPGNQGVENGDPNADRLTGISTSDGRVSGGLGGRGVVASPVVSENSQRPGKVVIEVCVGPDGRVLSANFTQVGSTTTDPNLVSAATRNAKTWKFKPEPTAPEEQCGKISYDFKVQ